MLTLKVFSLLTVIASVIASSVYKSLQSGISMPYAASDMSVTLYSKSLDSYGPRIYVVGGCISNQLCASSAQNDCYCSQSTKKCKYFTPDKPSWHDCTDAPTARYRHMAAIVGDYLYVIGGRDTNADALILSIEYYNILTDSWGTFATQLSTQAVSDGAAFAYGNKFYVVGGYSDTPTPYTTMNTMLAYDTTGSQTSFTGSPTTVAQMPTARGDIGLTQLDNFVYVTGGWESDFCTASNIVEKYNPVTDAWTTEAVLTHRRGDMVTGHLGGNIFSIAGEQKQSITNCDISVPVSYVGRYDPNANKWAIEENLSLSIFRFGGASYESASQQTIYLFGGQTLFNPNLGPYGGYAITDSVLQYVPYSVAKNFGLTAGQIAGIVIGILAFCTCSLGTVTLYLLYKR